MKNSKKHITMKRIGRMVALLLVMMMTVSCGAVRVTENPADNKQGENGKKDRPEYKNLSVSAKDMMSGVIATGTKAAKPGNDTYAGVTDFAMKLLKASYNEENSLVSGLSVLAALAMTANGAANETKTAMEKTLGLTAEEATAYIAKLMESLQNDEALALANSIWFKDDPALHIEQSFLQKNADFFKAALYKAPFNDSTVKDINAWVSNNTKGMIPELLKQIPEDAIMYLINALAFEAKWADPYDAAQVRTEMFTKENGSTVEAKFMHSKEDIYLQNDKATGFVKYYDGGKYAFVGLLPNAGVSVKELVGSLDGDSFRKMFDNRIYVTVNTSVPKFETSYSVEMKQMLSDLGMGIAFDRDNADFSELGRVDDGNIYIGTVIHKTFISVDEQGTKAAAATAVGMVEATSIGPHKQEYYVYLDHPFVYMLVDMATGVPFFTGVMQDVSAK